MQQEIKEGRTRGTRKAIAPVSQSDTHREQRTATAVYQVVIVMPVMLLLLQGVYRYASGFKQPALILWVVAIAAVDVMPVPAWNGLHMLLTFPIRLSVAILYPPYVAAAVAFVGSLDPREIKREIPVLRALFNRSQIALTVFAESYVFKWVYPYKLHPETHRAIHHPWLFVAGTLLAALVGYLVNTTIVLIAARIDTGLPVKEILLRMHGARPYQFLIEHCVLGLSAVVIVQFYISVGWLSAAVFLAALAFARQMYFQSRTLADRLAEQNDVLAEQTEKLQQLLATEQESVAELRELNRMKSEFVAVVSHELRTPLTAIIGFAKTLRRPEFADDATTRAEFLEAMERQGDRLLRLVENLLTVARLENSTLSPSIGRVSFADLCREIIEGLGASATRITARVPDQIPVLYTDRDLLGRVIANLLENALKYSPDGTPIEFGAETEEEHVVFWVKDQGIGIPAEEHERVFQRFYQVDSSSTRAFRGTGLGLALVKDLLEQLGGTVALESLPGEGSTFTVTLPFRVPDRPEADEPAGSGSDERSDPGAGETRRPEDDAHSHVA
jgi:signal transduction histidine kinase